MAREVPARSSVYRLPPDLRRRLDARLIRSGWGDYARHSEWLAGEGRAVSVSALRRYGARRRREIDTERLIESIRVSTDEATALAAALESEGVKLSEANQTLMQVRIYRALTGLRGDESIEEIAQLTRAHGTAARAGVALRREERAAAREQADRVARTAERHGVSPEGIAAIRAELEGPPA